MDVITNRVGISSHVKEVVAVLSRYAVDLRFCTHLPTDFVGIY